MAAGRTIPARRYTVDQFMRTVRMSGISFSHDEREILVTSNPTGVFNAYSISITTGAQRQLTYSTSESIKALSYFPHDRRILYVRDRGGIENRHLCVGETDGREVLLTHGEHVKSALVGWSAEGSYFYCFTNERNGKSFDLYRVDAQTYERRMIFRNENGYLPACISPHGNHACLIKYEGLSKSDLYLCDLKAARLKLITLHSGDICYLPLYFDSACQNLYYRATYAEDGWIEYRYDLKTGEREEYQRGSATIRQIVVSESKRYRVIITDEREGSSLVLIDGLSKRSVPLQCLPHGNITSAALSKSDRWLAFYVNGDRDPSELYVYDLASDGLSKLSSNVNAEIDRDDLVESEVVSFESFDGMKIPCLLWKPHEASRLHRVPALVWVHGGPIGQIRKGYAAAVQFLVNHGYAILGVNHRGSNGYGREFLNAADGRQGREPLWDCVEAKRYLAHLDYIDSDRIGIIGGSFGGYMSLAALTFHPHEFEVGISICGVSNLVRHLEAKLKQPQTARIYRQKLGDPVKDRAKLEAASPALHAERITKPLLVLHGAKDPRACRVESDDIVNAVRANGGIVEYLEFDDEAHGFRKRANSVRAYQAVISFLDKYLPATSLIPVPASGIRS